MFKNIFRRTKNEALPTENADNSVDESQGTIEQEQQQPIDEVLDQLCEDLDPWDRESYIVSVVEVRYLWARYQHLLRDNNDLTITDEVLVQEPFVSNYFLRQVWLTIPRDSNGNVTFPTFFGVVKWWQTVDQETKLKGIFKLLNNGQPLDSESLKHVLTKVDNNLDEESASRKAELLMLHLDNKNQGFIDEEQWIQGMGRLSSEEVHKLTQLFILPTISESVHDHPQCSSSPVPDEMLITISSKIGERDWKPLAQKLGFSTNEIKSLHQKYPNRSREQTYQMLKCYFEKEGATKQALAFALRRCALDDVVFSLQNK